jgi:hypothetical protein
MRKKLLKQQFLLVLLTMLIAIPQGVWAEDYPITVAGVQVTDANASGITGDYITGTVTFTPADDTNPAMLTLNGATIEGSISTSIDGLVIDLIGKNTITATEGPAILSTVGANSLALTFKSSGETVGSLTAIPDEENIAISGFTITYNNDLSLLPDYSEEGETVVVGISYGLTIDNEYVSNANADNILGQINEGNNQPTASYSDGVLTLNGVAFEGEGQGFISKTITSSEDKELTINLVGNNSISQIAFNDPKETNLGDLTITGTGSLNIACSDGVIYGASSINLGEGLYKYTNVPDPSFSEEGVLMGAGGNIVSSITISTKETYPIWIFDPQSDFGYTQLLGESAITIGEGTVSFDGDHTITISNVAFNYVDGTMIFVGPSMTELTVNLVGNSSIQYDQTGLSMWDTTPLTFTTSESTPGGLTGYGIVSWKGNGNEQITYQSGLKVFYDVDAPSKEIISTTGTYIKIGETSITGTRQTVEGYEDVSFDAETNTLTLSGATIGGATAASDIKAYVDDLKVEISGTNTINGNITYSGVNYRPSTIQITKKSGAESANLTVSNVNGFKSCTWDNDLYLSAHNGENAVAVKYEYDSNTWKFCSYYSNTSFDNITLSTTASNTLWVNGISPDADGYFTGIENVTFTPASSTTSATLTLNGATINGKILSSCEALTISFSGTNSLPETQGYIESTIPSAVLTLKGVATGQTASTLSLSNTVGKAAISGFASVNYDGAYVHYDDPFRYDTDSKEMKSVWGVMQNLTLSTAPSYMLWIGYTQVTDANKGNLTGANTPVATFTPASSENNNVNTITLSNATIEGKIRSGLGDLTILVDGNENFIYASDTGVVVRSVNAGTLTIKKKNNNASLTLSYGDITVGPGPLIKDFAAVDYSTDGFYLKSERPAEYATYTYVNDNNENVTTKGLIDPANPTSYLPSAEFTTTQTYPLWIRGEQVTTANASNILGEFNESNDEPTVSYNATDGILTLNGATISTNNPSPLIVCNGNLTVDLVSPSSLGFNKGSTYAFKNIGSTGELTFTSTSNTSEYGNYLSITSECYEGTYKGLCDGFTKVNFNNDLGLFNRSGSKTVGSIAGAAPIFDVVNTQQTCDLLTNEGLLLNATYHYKIDYVDETIEGNGVEVDLPLDETNHNISNVSLSISHPCTITAYAKKGDDIIASNKAKLFGVADKTIVLNSTTLDSELTTEMLEIVPENDATADGVSLSNLTIMGSENSGVVEYSEGTGKATIKALGVADLTVRAAVNGEEPKIKVLNQDGEVVMMTANVKVVPAAPTLTSNSTYIGDAIEITTDVEGGTIYYSWDETDNVGTLYSETAPVAQNGTLYAWVSYYDATSKQTLLGAKAQQTFEVVNNIENAVVVGLPASATYTGAAITPSFTVKASAEAEDNLVEGTDYTVRYEKVEGVQQPQEIQQPQAPRRAPEESESVTIKDAGGYIIIIEGKGNYGGTKTVGFTVNQASLANVTIAEIDAVTYTGADLTPTLTVTFGENAVDETEYTVKYEKGTAEVEAVVEPGQYDVTLTSTNKNFAANSTKSAKFNILPVAPTIAYNSEVTYLDTDEIEITAADGMKIFYTWETGDIFGSNEYNVTQDALMEYGTNTMPVATNGTLRAWAGYLLEDNIYLMSAEVTQAFTVKKDINNAAIYISAASATYTGAAITPEFTLKESEEEGAATISTDNYTVRYEKADDKPQAPRRAPEESESVTIKDAGDYLIIIEGKNEYGGTKNIPFEITQAENSLTTTPAAVAELIYTGDALELVTAGVAKFGDLLYKLGADGTYSATIPTATDANTTGYTVYYKVEGNDNYTGIEETSVVVTIDKATATITKAPAAKTLTYTGEALELVEAGTVSAGTMVYSMTIDGTFAEAIPTATNAGSYTVYYKVNGDDNYTGIEASETNKVTVTIGQAEITSVELVEATLPYSGEAQTPTIAKVMAGDIEVGAGYYEITGGNAKTAVGEYELTVAAKTMEGNNFKGSAKVAWSIVNRTLTVGEDVQFADGQKWASFYTPSEDLELPEGVMAYIVTGVNESEKSVTVKAVNKVLKSVPMLLENNSTETTTNVSAEGNLLQVATEATAVSSINGTVYGLYNNAMMRVTTGTIALGKCYLVVNGKQNAPRLTITKDDQATGIESLTPALSEGEGAWYTIDGKKLQQKPTKKGIYIVNGKKMVVNNK